MEMPGGAPVEALIIGGASSPPGGGTAAAGQRAMETIVNGLESHFMTALFVSAALALLITGVVALVWWRSRHWVERGRTSLATSRHTALFSQAEPPPPSRRPGGSAAGDPGRPEPGPSAGELGSRLVREAAVRAAALRDAWDRSYREARGPAAAGTSDVPVATGDVSERMDELLREQRATNALLRQLLERLTPPQG